MSDNTDLNAVSEYRVRSQAHKKGGLRMKSYSSVGLVAALTLTAGGVAAQGEIKIEEVVVTATKQEKTLADIPSR